MSSSSNRSPSVPGHFQTSAVQQHIQAYRAPKGSTWPPGCRAGHATQKQTGEIELVRACEAFNMGPAKRIRPCAVEKKFEARIVPVELGNTKTQAEGRGSESLDFGKPPAPFDPKSGLAGDEPSTSTLVEEKTDITISELPKPRAPASLTFKEDAEPTDISMPIPPADDWEALKAYACGPSASPSESPEATVPLPPLPGLESMGSSAPPLCFQSTEALHINKLQSSPTPFTVYSAQARLCQPRAPDTFTVHGSSDVLARPRPHFDRQLKQGPRLEHFPAHLNPPPGLVHPAIRRGLREGKEQEELVVGLCRDVHGGTFVEHELEDFLIEEAAKEVGKEGHASRGRPKLESRTKNKQRAVGQRCEMKRRRTDESISSQPKNNENPEEEDGEVEKLTVNARDIWAEVRRVLGNTEWAYGWEHPVLPRCVPPVSSVRIRSKGEGTRLQ